MANSELYDECSRPQSSAPSEISMVCSWCNCSVFKASKLSHPTECCVHLASNNTLDMSKRVLRTPSSEHLTAARWSCPVHGAWSKHMPAAALTSELCCRLSSSSSLIQIVEQSSLTANPIPGQRNSQFTAFQSCNTCCSAYVLPKCGVPGFFLRQGCNTHDSA